MLYPGQASTKYHSGRLVINVNLEAIGAPIHKLDGMLGLDASMAGFPSLGTTSPGYNNYQAMYLPWGGTHFTIWLPDSKQALVLFSAYRKLFMIGSLSRDDRYICGQKEVDAGIGHQVGLEFCQVNI